MSAPQRHVNALAILKCINEEQFNYDVSIKGNVRPPAVKGHFVSTASECDASNASNNNKSNKRDEIKFVMNDKRWQSNESN